MVGKGINKENIVILANIFEKKGILPNVPKKYDVIYAGQFIQSKRLDIFLEVIALFKSKNMKAAIVGRGNLRNYLVEYISNLGIEENVDIIDFTPNVEKSILESKILVLTSENEGLPQILVEAMSCGLPCIVPRVGDIEDFAIDGFNSIVVEPLDINAYYKAIKSLLDDKLLYSTYSRNALSSVDESFSLQKISKEWDNLIQ